MPSEDRLPAASQVAVLSQQTYLCIILWQTQAGSLHDMSVLKSQVIKKVELCPLHSYCEA